MSHLPGVRVGRRSAVVMLLLALVVWVGGASSEARIGVPRAVADDDGEHPAPPQPYQPYTDCAGNDGVPYASGLPALPCLPYPGTDFNRVVDAGAYFGDITQQVAGASVSIALQALVARVFYSVCLATPVAPCPAGFDIEVPDPLYPTYYGVVAQVYVQSALGASPQFGAFAPVTVSATAFGVVPVSARVSIRQAVDAGGVVRPLQLVWGSAGNVTPGTVFGGSLARYGPAPAYPPDPALPDQPGNATLFPDAHVLGPITITVDDVTVDRVPLDVGTTCSTSTTLDLTAPGGWRDARDVTPIPGLPGAYNPFFTPSYLTSDVDIPAFEGCRDAKGQDLSPLVSGLVSGSGNRLDVTQLHALVGFACLDANRDPNICSEQHPATVDPRDVVVGG